MNRHLHLARHEEPNPLAIETHDRRLLIQPAAEAPPPPHQIQHREARVASHRQRQLPGGMDGEIAYAAAAVGGDGLEVDEGVGVVDADGAVVGGGEEVAGEREGGGGVEEGEGGDGAVMVR